MRNLSHYYRLQDEFKKYNSYIFFDHIFPVFKLEGSGKVDTERLYQVRDKKQPATEKRPNG